MSAITGTSPDLYSWLQSLNAPGQTATSGAPDASTTPSVNSDPNAPTEAATKGATGHHHHGHHLSSQLESAITSALNSDDGTSDPNTVVQDAIKKFLASGNPAGDPAAANAGGTNGSGVAPDASGAATSGDPAAAQSFEAVLKSYGIDPAQFQKDLHAALQNGDGSSVDFAQLFKSLPVGSTVDTVA